MSPYIYIVLPSYMVCAFLGALVSVLLLYFRTEKYDIEFNSFLKLIVASVIGVLIGSKVMFFISRVPWLISHFSVKNLLSVTVFGGFVFYGGLFGMITSILLVTNKNKSDREKYFAFFVPVMPLFHGFGRIGCFMSGCCYGKKLPSPFVVYGLTIDRIPVQIIEAVFEFVIFGVLVVVIRKSPKANVLKIYLISYAVFRFVIEFFRGDLIRGVWFGISLAQWISIIIIVSYIIKSVRKAKTKRA